MLRAPRGTFDVLPPDSSRWSYLEELLRRISGRYNYEEIRTPVLEHSELFSRTVGEATDIVQKEMYTFKDKTGRHLTLRPEGTAPCARAFVEHGMQAGPLPRKLFYLGPMFRYEKPQAGRYREFHHYGAEIFGSSSPYSDVEVIMLAMDIANELGLSGTRLVINTIGCSLCRKDYRTRLTGFLKEREEELCPDCQDRLERNPLRVLDCKLESCRSVVRNAPAIMDYLCSECKDHWDELREVLSSMGLAYSVDTALVRGLDYYTRTVFELKWPPLGAQDALLGGGRYDGLVEEIGGKPTPGVGFAMGLERMMTAAEKGSKPIEVPSEIDLFVIAQEEKFPSSLAKAFGLVMGTRRAGFSSDFDPEQRSIKSQMKQADRLNARYVAIFGEEEMSKGCVSLRIMSDGRQETIRADEVIAFLRREVNGNVKQQQ